MNGTPKNRYPVSRIIASLILLCPLVSFPAASECQPGRVNEGSDQWIEPSIDALKSMGFNCLDEKRDLASSRRCVGRIPGYSGKVAIYIPIHFDPEKDPPSLITHFHGHVVENDSFEGTLNRYHLGTELHRSERNSLLIVPESTGKCDTYKKELSTANALQSFHSNVISILKKTGFFAESLPPDSITHEITGHSGAYWPIGNILRESMDLSPPVRVGLFDATYCSGKGENNPGLKTGSTACRGIHDYANQHPGSLKSYFLENSPTAKGSNILIPGPDRIALSQNRYNHFTVMNENYSAWLRQE